MPVDYDIPPERKLGYEKMVEMREIRAQVRAEHPDVGGSFIHFESERRYMERHKDDPTYREKCEARNARMKKTIERWKPTPEQVEYLLEMTADANHPVAQQIAEDLKRIYWSKD